MPGNETGGVGNFWYSFHQSLIERISKSDFVYRYSFDYGLVHFVAFDGETDFAYSPEWPFLRDTGGNGDLPTEAETFSTDSGPFGYIEGPGSNVYNTTAYEQYQWMKADLEAVDRAKTPWVSYVSRNIDQTDKLLGHCNEPSPHVQLSSLFVPKEYAQCMGITLPAKRRRHVPFRSYPLV